jgi:putative FmdB family regulatory protein
MPTYDYECPEGHTFEAFQKMTDEPVAKCPECGKAARRKISGGAGFLFKGEGFYITDYRSDDYKKKASSESGESASPGTAKSGESATTSDAPSKASKTSKSSKAASASKAEGGSKGGKGSGSTSDA